MKKATDCLVDLEAITMNKIAVVLVLCMFLAGCSSLQKATSAIPSFWDDNQSAAVIDIRQSIELLDCDKNHAKQVEQIDLRIQWFELYSESKGSRQKDVLKLIAPLKLTTQDFLARSRKEQGSVYYCESKKSILKVQSEKAAEAVMRRF